MTEVSNIHHFNPTSSKPGRQLAMTHAAIKQRAYRERQKKTARKPTSTPVTQPVTLVTEPVTATSVTPRVRPSWSGIGRGLVGLAIVLTGGFIAFTSMRANSWFGHSMTPDPAAGEVYSHLSVAAEVLATLLPTGIMFYGRDGRLLAAARGWLLMAIALIVVFFAAGGFAMTNLNAGVEARAERESPAIHDLRVLVAGLDKSIASECTKRGAKCRDLEAQRAAANERLDSERASVRAAADPQAAAIGVDASRLHLVQAASIVLLCLMSGLYISFGMGILFRE
jgi:hypothetical protein